MNPKHVKGKYNRKEKVISRKLDWFMDRIGKVVYRKDCKNHGLKINDEFHARYIHMMQCDLDLEYADKPFKSNEK